MKRKYNPGVGDILGEATMVKHAPRLGRQPLPGAGRLGAAGVEPEPALRALRRAGELHRPGPARDARRRPRAARVPAGAGRGAAGSPSWPTGSCRPTRPKQYAPGGTYVVIGAGIASVNEWANAIDAGARVHLAAAQPEARRAGPEHAALPVRGVRHRHLPGAHARAAADVPGEGPEGHGAARAAAGTSGSSGAGPRAASTELQGEIDQVQPGPAGLRDPHLEPATATTRAGSTCPASSRPPASRSRR